MWESGLYWGAMALVAYGAANALNDVGEWVRSLRLTPPIFAYLVLVRDQADRLEGLIRALAEGEPHDLLLVDLASADDSLAILERLVVDYGNAQLFRFGREERTQAIAAAMKATDAPFVLLVELLPDMEEEGKTRRGANLRDEGI